MGGACGGALRWRGGAGLLGGRGLAVGRGFVAGQVEAGLAAGRDLLQLPRRIRVPCPGCQRPHGVVLTVSRGVRTTVPEPGE